MRKIASFLLALVAGAGLVAGACTQYSTTTPEPEPGETGVLEAGASVEAAGPALPDGGVERDAEAPCPADAACIGFEDGDANDLTVTGNDCMIDDVVAHGGGHALHCKGTTRSYVALSRTFPPSAPLSFRAFVRGIPAPGTSAPSVGYVGFIDPGLDIPLMMVGDVSSRRYALWWSTTQGGGFIDSAITDGSPAWTCVEAVFASPTTLTFYVNGSQVDQPRLDATLGTAPLAFRVGLPYRQTQDVAEVYVDDIAVGATRIGCQ